MKNKGLILGSIAVLVLGFLALTFAFKSDEQEKKQNLAKAHGGEPFIRAHSAILGSKDAKVTIVEFIDPSCPPCAYFSKVVKRVVDEHEDVNVVVRYLARFKGSAYMIKVLEASRKQGLYAETLELVLHYQSSWADAQNPKVLAIWQLLPQIKGLDIKKLQADVQAMDISELLKLDAQDASTLGVRGTPTLFVNGQELEELGYSQLDELVISKLYE